jgi:tungstate transport system substrate-binding protein
MAVRRSLAVGVLIGSALFAGEPGRIQKAIGLASTTSVENSGLFAHILPEFTKETGIAVRVLAQGTGQALATAAHGNAIWYWCTIRRPRTSSSPKGTASIAGRSPGTISSWSVRARIRRMSRAAMTRPRRSRRSPPPAPRSSRAATGAAPTRSKSGSGARPGATPRAPAADRGIAIIGGGMGAALNTASAMGAYTLSDRGTWLSFGNKGGLTVLVEGDPRLLNRYDVILLDPKRHPEAKQTPARRFADWLASAAGQAAIGAYELNGEQLFHPSATDPK